VDDHVLEAMEAFADVAPAHNPPYTKAMRMLRERFPQLPLVAAFETGFHRTIPEARQRYAIPDEWTTSLGVRRWGFHGASHRYISWRVPELLGRKDIKIISCHLGGSSSLCAMRNGQSVGCSLGMSPQSGLPHNNRVGDFDVFALPVLLRETGKSLDEILDILANHSGLQGLCGHCDLRDIESGAGRGDARAELAIDVFIDSIRHYLGSFLLELEGADAIAFTGGIGENSASIRSGVCDNLSWLGIELDPVLNAGGPPERRVSVAGSRVQVWTVPTNEEIVVATQAEALLNSGQASSL
jgi:acetate kinase